MKIPCIQKFRLNEIFIRFQNGISSTFYFYFFYGIFYKTFNMMFLNYSRKYKYICNFIAIITFYQLGYHGKLL